MNFGKLVAVLVMVCFAAAPAAAKHAHRVVRHSAHAVSHAHQRVVDVLRGSRERMAAQNIAANAAHLQRIRNDRQLAALKHRGELVPIREDRSLRVDPRLNPKFRYVRQHAAAAVHTLADEFGRVFHRPIVVTSAVRTLDYQRQLRRRNTNAAKAESGLHQSSHPTGETMDIAKRGMSSKQLGWMRTRLRTLSHQRQVVATEEHRQPVFHVMFVPAQHRPPHVRAPRHSREAHARRV
jgi:uncharacterized protein YcbK (DUF882 family)